MPSTSTVLYDPVASWERDFICNELIPKDARVETLTPISLASEAKKRSGKLAIIFSSNHIPCLELMPWFEILKPDAAIHVSDEFAPGLRQPYNALAEHCSLYIRQYNHGSYKYSSNTRFMALGYGSGLLSSNEKSGSLHVTPVAQRKLPWAFVGALKEDRAEMIRAFQKISGGQEETRRVNIREMRLIYEQAIFAPCGRGNSVLECFRIYEAIILGSIPVIVGEPEEITRSLLHISPAIPFLNFSNWPQASEACKILLKDKEELQALQNQCLDFWRQHVRTLQTLLNLAIKVGLD